MVIVNGPGSWSHVYRPLLHSDWHGITATDLIFPFFLFIVGVSITLAFTRQLESGADKRSLYRKIFSRALKIMLLGWFLSLWPNFNLDDMRYAGVLPRISLVYLVCAILFLNTNWKQQLCIGTGILLGYWAALALLPVPIDAVIQLAIDTGQVKYSEGQLAIGEIRRISDSAIAANYQPGVNITAWVDRMLLPGSFWQVTWDPEGLASTLPAVVTGIIGILVGRVILTVDDSTGKLSRLLFIGVVLSLAGMVWGWWMPLNKNLWTSSFTLLTAGLATIGLAACIFVVDILGYQRWTKLGRVYGANAITSYVLAGMLTVFFYHSIFGEHSLNGLWMEAVQALGISAKLASLSYAVLYMLIIYIPVWILYKKKIHIKV